MFHGPDKPLHKSYIAMQRPQSSSSRVDDELMQKSYSALHNTTDPLERLRLMCLTRGSDGILALARVFRRLARDGSNKLNKEQFDTEALFNSFDADNTGCISLDKFLDRLRPPMPESRRDIVAQVFKNMDKSGHGVITIDDIRKVYSVNCSPRYKSGEDTEDYTMNKFLANFEGDDSVDGTVTLEEFMNYYSAISLSIDTDCYFDLMMRQAYKL
ncbi:unnamed protein product [Leptidea sinapis]|uniref:EF-hand domain-containing protein n=1 Tax=Leptidea sinapis TaxID=189913 RepID=A0A5E4R092_9NEOP|nr:unnamed protein product [Leptidea sinapis]